ncbi:DUF2584 family protein [Halobacillus mangrovi]|uniref:DUF2584 domain-containing protein n=1 Tax=Halobacillus mangrovi TaxID=402384 RepID=A0A1W5ZVK1_9BACI|nr:DUF2584 family protein [Halobacillus mangrovi]ARI77318.1 hypothetical protein HM131_10895 [Halobacillus mangrovi]
MSTPFTMEWLIITEGREKRVNEGDNLFEIAYEGYKLFPINEPLEIRKHFSSKVIGSCVIEELILKNQATHCKYRLISLNSVN